MSITASRRQQLYRIGTVSPAAPAGPTIAEQIGYDMNDTTGVVAWYVAELGVTIDGAVGGGVNKWANKIASTGSTYDLNQTVVTSQPNATATTIGGKAAITFDGTTDRLLTNTFPSQLPQPAWQFVVWRMISTTGLAQSKTIIDGIASGFRQCTFYVDNTRLPRMLSSSSVSGTSPAFAVSTNYITTSKYASPSSFLKINNGAVTGLTAATTGTNSITGLNIGSAFTGGTTSNIAVAEVVICSSAFASESTVYNRLAARYGI